MSSYLNRKSHCGDKTIFRPSYLHNGISHTGKMTSLYWIRFLVAQAYQRKTSTGSSKGVFFTTCNKKDTNFILCFCTLHITSRSFLYLATYMYNSISIVVDHKHMRDTVFGNLSWWPTNYKTPIDKVSVQYIDLCHFWSKQNLVKNLRTCAAYSSIPRSTWIMVVRVR